MRTLKRCCTCREDKPPTEFFRSKATLDGRMYKCKKCSLAYKRKRRARGFRDDRSREGHRRYKLHRRYGLSDEQVAAMIAEQGGGCAICTRRFGPKRRVVIDHCHESGRVRGALCFSCNTRVGFLERSGLLPVLHAYLSKCP